jgi:peptide/nickel transport system permease protein
LSATVNRSIEPQTSTAAALISSFRQVVGTLFEDRTLLMALAVIMLLLGLAVLGPVFWAKDPTSVDAGSVLEPPSAEHLMGTDGAGRDVFARFYAGARISLTVGAIVVTLGAIIGGLVGMFAGTSGGWLDNLLMRLMDAILAFPPLILVMAITIGLGVGIRTAAIGIIITSVPWYARLIRSEVIRVRSLPFIEAAVAIGASRTRIIGRHVIPHVISTLLVQAAASFGYAILTLAALGFVGLGAQIPTPEWGAMITEGLAHAITGRWWVGVFPGLGVLMAVTAANIIADRTRALLDPRGTLSNL